MMKQSCTTQIVRDYVRQRCLLTVCTAVATVLYVTPAFACACCADPGMHIEAAHDLEDYERDELGRLRFSESAQLYTTDAFPEDIKGVTSPSLDAYVLKTDTSSKGWTFEVADKAGNTGSIAFAIPTRIEWFFVDPRTGESPGSPQLYKEWRLVSTVQLSGTVAKVANNADATLILQGRGNGCTMAEDFTHWILKVRGPEVQFSLIGKMAKPN